MKKFFKTTASKVVELPVISMEEVEVIPVYVAKMAINASKEVMAQHLMKQINKDNEKNQHGIFAPCVYSWDWSTNAVGESVEYFLEVTENPEERTIVIKKRIYKFC